MYLSHLFTNRIELKLKLELLKYFVVQCDEYLATTLTPDFTGNPSYGR